MNTKEYILNTYDPVSFDVSVEDAYDALDNLDDYCRMADIKAIGAIGVLIKFIEQCEKEGGCLHDKSFLELGRENV